MNDYQATDALRFEATTGIRIVTQQVITSGWPCAKPNLMIDRSLSRGSELLRVVKEQGGSDPT